MGSGAGAHAVPGRAAPDARSHWRRARVRGESRAALRGARVRDGERLLPRRRADAHPRGMVRPRGRRAAALDYNIYIVTGRSAESPELMDLEGGLVRFRTQRLVRGCHPFLGPAEEDAVAAIERLGRGRLHENDRALALSHEPTPTAARPTASSTLRGCEPGIARARAAAGSSAPRTKAPGPGLGTRDSDVISSSPRVHLEMGVVSQRVQRNEGRAVPQGQPLLGPAVRVGRARSPSISSASSGTLPTAAARAGRRRLRRTGRGTRGRRRSAGCGRRRGRRARWWRR